MLRQAVTKRTSWAELARLIVEKIKAEDYEETVEKDGEIVGYVLDVKALEEEAGVTITASIFHPEYGRKILRGAGFVFSKRKGERKLAIAKAWLDRVEETLFGMGEE